MALGQTAFVWILVSIYMCQATNMSEDDDIELDEELKLLNKPPVETFLTEEGDTIDCIDIDKQPALDHPNLLKNHKVQRKPYLPQRDFFETSSNRKNVPFRPRRPCPIGTVPIQRIKKEDLIRTKSLRKMPYDASVVEYQPVGQHHATIWNPNIRKYGASAFISVYNLSVAEDQFISHYIRISTGPRDQISMIVAAWEVNHMLNGDYLTRLSAYWTGNGWRDGCHNTLCPGFVQVDRIITPNYPIIPVSTHGGRVYELKIEVFQDIATGNWWFRVHDPPINVGYWPKELFVNLQNGTFTTAWGGLAQASANGYCPPMGNGGWPDADYRKAGYFRMVQWMNANGDGFPPDEGTLTDVDKPSCYGLQDLGWRPGPWGYYFSFGGPGGYCGA